MREIKFRAWSFDDSFMVDEFYDDFDFLFTADYGKPRLLKAEFNQICGVITGYAECNHTMMQFTGLKDKNGVEIYEGDIIKSHFYGEDYNVISKIEYDDSSAAFVYDSAEQGAFVYGAENGKLEVIGNIHENPELLT